MCRKPEHGQDRPKPAETRKFFEKYLGKLNTSIVDTNLSFAVNFNYQVYSICENPNPPSTSTPTFDSELGVEIDTSTFLIPLFFRIIKYSKSLKFDTHSVAGKFDTIF